MATYSVQDCWCAVVAAGWLVAARSHPGAPPAVHVARLLAGELEGPLQWTPVVAAGAVDYDAAVCAALDDIQVDTLQVGSRHLPFLLRHAYHSPRQSVTK